ncbi:MAG: hypothetical protein PVG79_12935 [Gemmatimonadales bacterium]|jgi:hypothetical protein
MIESRPHRTVLTVLLLALAGCADEAGTRVDEPTRFDPHFQLEERLAIGGEDTFGRISDLIADERGHIYVLDLYFKKLDRFDASGAQVATLGREGEGPGEFSYPRALAFWGGADLLVFDQRNLRLTEVATEDDALSLVKEARVPLSPFEICTLSGRIFTLGLFAGHVVHELSPAGEIIASFGEPYSDDPIIQDIASFGHLLCDEATATILVVPAMFPQVRAYALSGELRWAVELADYNQTVYERSGVSVRPRPHESGRTHSAAGVVAAGPDVALVQLRLRSAEPEAQVEIESRFLSLADGTEIARRSDLPQLMYVRDSVAYATVEDPYPRVLVLDMR